MRGETDFIFNIDQWRYMCGACSALGPTKLARRVAAVQPSLRKTGAKLCKHVQRCCFSSCVVQFWVVYRQVCPYERLLFWYGRVFLVYCCCCCGDGGGYCW